MMTLLSVTVLTGSPGTDGAHTLEQIIHGPAALRVAAIVPPKQAATLRGVSVFPTTERLVRLGKGCACCTVRDDLRSKIAQIAAEQTADHVVVHAPHGDLVTLAKTFTVADSDGAALSTVARIESLVAVVDATRFFATMQTAAARSLCERIEFANVIVVENTAALTDEAQKRVMCALGALNPSALVTRSDADRFTLSSVRVARSFDLRLAQQRAAQFDHDADYSAPIERFTYHARRPFHPSRLRELLDAPLAGVLRARGVFWVASCANIAGTLDVAGGSRDTFAEGMWWAAIPSEQYPSNQTFRDYLASIWHPAFGDRHQELFFVGINVDETDLRRRLDRCLLTNRELARPERWSAMPHPFPWPPEQT